MRRQFVVGGLGPLAQDQGSEITKLIGHGFVEISTANGQYATAEVTRAGRTSTRRVMSMMGLLALFSIAMIGYLYGCDVSDD